MARQDWLVVAAALAYATACSNAKTADGGQAAVDVADDADAQTSDTATATDAAVADATATDAAPADAAGTDAAADANDVGTDAVTDVSDVGTDAATLDAAADVGSDAASADTSTDTSGMNACQALGGICASSASDCTSGSGTYKPAGDAGCVFDDGPGACCIPPPMVQAKATCADFGGICAPIAGCNFVNGAYAAFEGCKGIPMICCVPNTLCGDETMSCCDTMTTYRTACDHGTWMCTIGGTTLKPTDQCPK